MTNKKYSGDSFVEFSPSRGTEESITVTEDILDNSGLSSPQKSNLESMIGVRQLSPIRSAEKTTIQMNKETIDPIEDNKDQQLVNDLKNLLQKHMKSGI